MAQIGAAVPQQREPALLDACSVPLLQTPILHTEQNSVKVGSGARFAAKLHVVGQAAGREVLQFVSRVIAAIDSPEVAHPKRNSAPRAIGDMGSQKSAAPRDLGQ